MTYNPRIQNVDNDTVDISGNLSIIINNGYISGNLITANSLTASILNIENYSSSVPVDINLKNIKRKTRTITSSIANLTQQESVVFVSPQNTATYINLPSAGSSNGAQYAIKKINSNIGNINIYPSSTFYPWILEKKIDSNPDASDAAEYRVGTSVDMNYSGNVVVAGASAWVPTTSSFVYNDKYGALFVYRSSSLGWNQEARLNLNSPNTGDQFGTSVAINASGNVIVGGCPFSDSPTGSAGSLVIFRSSSLGWIEEAVLTSSGDLIDGPLDDRLGSSVAINALGNVVIGGSPLSDSPSGSAGSIVVFRSSSLGWIQEAVLTSSGDPINGALDDRLGTCVAINALGDIIVGGAPQSDSPASNAGGVIVFRSSSLGWTQEAFLTGAFGSQFPSGDQLGISISINGSGNIIASGYGSAFASGTSDDAVAIFRSSSIGWQQESYITATNPVNSANFGYSVDINNNGNKIIIGSYTYSTGSSGSIGAVYFFDSSSIGWRQRQLVTSSRDGYPIGDLFGSSVALDFSGNIAAAGILFYDIPYTDIGAISILNSSSVNRFREEIVLTASLDSAVIVANDYFGHSIDMNTTGNIIIAGSRFYDVVSGAIRYPNQYYGPGAVIVLKSSSNGWYEESLLTSSNTGATEFGFSVSANKNFNTVIAGSPNMLDGSGSIVVFRSSSIGWREETILTSSAQPGRTNNLGWTVYVNNLGNEILAGVPSYSSSFSSTGGAIVIFRSSSIGWRENSTITSSRTSFYFGESFVTNDDKTLICVNNTNYSSSLYGGSSGAGMIYRSSSVGWRLETTLEPRINNGNTFSSPTSRQQCGLVAGISPSGNLIALDCWDRDTREYGIFIYKSSSAGWNLQNSPLLSSSLINKVHFWTDCANMHFNSSEDLLVGLQRAGSYYNNVYIEPALVTFYSSSRGWDLGSYTSLTASSINDLLVGSRSTGMALNSSGNIISFGIPQNSFISGNLAISLKGNVFVYDSVPTSYETINESNDYILTGSYSYVSLVSDGTSSWYTI